MITLHFQFELYHIVVELSFLCSNQPCIIVTFLVFLFLADQIFLHILLIPAAFWFVFVCIILFIPKSQL